MLVVNGKSLEIEPRPETVQKLIEHLQLTDRRLVVERNKEIVDPSQYDTEQLASGDRIEIVHFVGGG